MRKKTAFVVLALLAFSFTVGIAVEILASDPRARNISIFRIDGDDARISRNTGWREAYARNDQRLHSGNIVSTGRDTQVNFALFDVNNAAIYKMDVSSRVQVSVTRRRLSLTLSLGSALVNVTDQEAGQGTYIVVGNTTFSVRGTMFTMSKMDEGHALIVMLSGEGYVEMPGADPVPLMARQVMAIYETGLNEYEQVFAIYELSMGILPLFVLEEIVNNSEYLLAIGTITEEMLEEALRLIPLLIAERELSRAFWDAHVDMLVQNNPTYIRLFPFEEYEIEEEYVLEPDDEAQADDLPMQREAVERFERVDVPITITWNPNGGFASPNHSVLVPGTRFFDLPVPERSGFVFVGWFDTSAPLGGNQITQASVVPNVSTTFWARWSQHAVTITWNPNGGSVMPSTTTHTPGSFFTHAPLPERSGFVFEGWFDTSAPTGGNQLTHLTVVPNLNTTFWARWSQQAVTIIWDPTGGWVSPTFSAMMPGGFFPYVPVPVRSGFVFAGWFDTSATWGGSQLTPMSVVPSVNTTFWARWITDRPLFITITWNPNNGHVSPGTSHLIPGTRMCHNDLPIPTRQGFRFVGWYNTSAAIGGTRLEHGWVAPSVNTTFWARWVDDFVAVTSITGAQSTGTADVADHFMPTVIPANATNQNITWSILSDGGTDTDIWVVAGEVFFWPLNPGTLVLRATIPNGTAVGVHFTQDFTIIINP